VTSDLGEAKLTQSRDIEAETLTLQSFAYFMPNVGSNFTHIFIFTVKTLEIQ